MTSCLAHHYELVQRRIFLILWISLVLYIFYDSFTFYKNGRQFHYLRQMLGMGLCVSRGTATVLNLCCALVLLPLCKKLNLLLYRILSQLSPGLFFYWLEHAKTFHMAVACTLVIFAVIHSISHFCNMWNFSRFYDEVRVDINFAAFKNESPLVLLMSQAGLTGVLMLAIVVSMGIMSSRAVRRRLYNAFWYTHQLYLPFMMLLFIHPLSGALKEEVLEENYTSPKTSHLENHNVNFNNTTNFPKFTAIKSQTWLWMALPLCCFFLDTLWRVFSRNRVKVEIIEATQMPGRTISVRMSHARLQCRPGQYVLLQCADISRLEWHPFTVVKVPNTNQKDFVVWMRVRGDWTEALEKLLIDKGPRRLSLLLDGPFASPMQNASCSDVAICVAAGVGITPFVAMLHHILMNPRSHLPGRVHLLWIVRHECELSWLASLANRCLQRLREANRPDRLHLQFYVTGGNNANPEIIVILNNRGAISHIVDDEKATLLTPKKERDMRKEEKYDVAKEYPILGCRVSRGRPHWDRVFGYWVHLYPGYHLNLYCCGPKKLVKAIRSKCVNISATTKTKFTFVHEGFS